jgi:general secretion pathway protein J
MSPRDAPSEDAGFTVVELIVCLGLLSLMTVLIAEGLAVAQRGTRIFGRVDRLEQEQAVQAYLRRAVQGIVPLFAVDRGNVASLVFSGAPDRLRFASRADGRLEGNGVVLVEIRCEQRNGERALVTERRLLEASAAKSDGPDVHVLLPSVGSVSFRYLGRHGAKEAIGWSSRWEDPRRLPLLVEIDVAYTGSNESWPPLAIAVPAASSATN